MSMKKSNTQFLIIVPLFLSLAIFLCGCSPSDPANCIIVKPLASGVQLANYSNLELRVQKQEDVKMTADDLKRISDLITWKIKEKDESRFAQINPQEPQPSTLRCTVLFTKYDPGNAIARFMLAGLGQIHINANFALTDATTNGPLYECKLDKTFAMGGVYGDSVGVEDVEEGIANSVVATILGKK